MNFCSTIHEQTSLLVNIPHLTAVQPARLDGNPEAARLLVAADCEGGEDVAA